MPRRLRIQYPDAIYHVMARGNGRQDIVRDDADRDRLQEFLGRAAVRCSWHVYAFAILSNHLHVVLKTPQPNLAKGMQTFLSAYANVWARRHQFSGHVFQGRYRTELIEDETYLWNVTRYVHLNPVRAGLVERPAAWKWSSYRGYARHAHRLDWVAYEELHQSWNGAFGGSVPAAAYRKYVSNGLAEPSKSPWLDAHHGWILGSVAFVDRVGSLIRAEPRREQRRESRMVRGLPLTQIRDVICRYYAIERSLLTERANPHLARAALAYLARLRTTATNAELAAMLGLSRAESVPNLTKRFRASLASHAVVREQLNRIETELDRIGSSPET